MPQDQKFSTVLPKDFDGVFRFTNPSDEDFVFKWNKKVYLFPANKTTPMRILDATAIEIQEIRKRAAKQLAEREFYKSDRYKNLTVVERNSDGTPRLNSFQQGNVYSNDELKDYIQQCLTPLPEAVPLSADAPSPDITPIAAKPVENHQASLDPTGVLVN